MMLTHIYALPYVLSLNDDESLLESLRICQVIDAILYAAKTEELPILIIAESNFVKNPDKLSPFHAPTFYPGRN